MVLVQTIAIATITITMDVVAIIQVTAAMETIQYGIHAAGIVAVADVVDAVDKSVSSMNIICRI